MLRVHETAIQLVREVMPLLEMVERRDPDLARQGRRAVTSTPLNIAEGSDQSGKRRAQHYRIALGSAREIWSVMRAAGAAGYMPAPSADVINTLNTVIGPLHHCIYKKR